MTEAVHVETQLMTSLVDVLSDCAVNGKPVPVYRSRVYSRDSQQMPCIVAYAPNTAFQTKAVGGAPGQRVTRRLVDVKVVLCFARPAAVENTLEGDLMALALTVENKLSCGFSLGSGTVVSKMVPVKRDTGFVGESSSTVVVCVYHYQATIDHREGAAQTALAGASHLFT